MSADPIIIKSKSDIEHMRRAGRITAAARIIARQAVAAGVTTKTKIDREVHDFYRQKPCLSHLSGLRRIPYSACTYQ